MCLPLAGVYLCIKAYGDVSLNFSLRAAVSQCPGDFSNTGDRMECSSPVSASDKRYTGCNDDGTCICSPPYQKPIPQPYAGAAPRFVAYICLLTQQNQTCTAETLPTASVSDRKRTQKHGSELLTVESAILGGKWFGGNVAVSTGRLARTVTCMADSSLLLLH